jgi:hypothetical protein
MKVSFQSKGDWAATRKWLKQAASNAPTQAIKEIANRGEQALKAGTPKATGETATGWYAEVKGRGPVTEIIWKNRAHPESKVSVALLIENGHGTRTGGYVPPRPYVKQAMESVWAIAGDTIAKEMIK